jgi:hypothetical protein
MIYLVESSCSTHRAAELLQISVSKIRLPSFAVVIVMLWAIGFVGDGGRSLVDVGNRRSGLWVVRVRSLFDVGKIGDRVYGW